MTAMFTPVNAASSSSATLRCKLNDPLLFDKLFDWLPIVEAQRSPRKKDGNQQNAGIARIGPIRCVSNVVEVAGNSIALLRVGGRVFGFQPECPHQGGSLADGDIEDIAGVLALRCPRHHWAFNLATGQLMRPQRDATIKIYPVDVDAKTRRLTVAVDSINFDRVLREEF